MVHKRLQTRTGSLLAKLALALASILVAAVLAELALRMISGEKVKLDGLWTADEVLGAALKPGFSGFRETAEYSYRVEINELGMRDNPLGKKTPATRRILLIGDSFVYGQGVKLEHSISKTLERQLRHRSPGVRFEVLNGGIPGSSTFHQHHFLLRLAPQVQPSLVVLIFFIGDDWFGNVPRPRPEQARQGFAGWLSTKSVFFRYFRRFVLSSFKGSHTFDIHRIEADEAFRGRLTMVQQFIEDMRAASREHDAGFLVVFNPRYAQVYDNAWASASLVYQLDQELYSVYEPNRSFSKRLSASGIWHVDLLDSFREEVKERALHFPVDRHWNIEGNEFVASALAEVILGRPESYGAEVDEKAPEQVKAAAAG